MENTQAQQTPMERYFEQLLANQSRQREQSDNYYDLAKKTAAQQSEWMDMLMSEYRKKQSANPFIALLDGYIGMKKRKNPEYEWRGLATTVPEAIGGLLGRSRTYESIFGDARAKEYNPPRELESWPIGGK
ncbi:MAG: hypothetical protein PHX12_06035 [Proteiniphilum sp.]|nr:hypothetical protein [Proteiniphilum sp.]